MSYWLEAGYHLSKQSLAWYISNCTNTYAPITDFLVMFCYGNTKAYWLHFQIKAQFDACKHTIAYNTFIFETCLTVAAKKINVWGPARLTFNKQNNLWFIFFPSTLHGILVLLFYDLMISWYLENSTKLVLDSLGWRWLWLRRKEKKTLVQVIVFIYFFLNSFIQVALWWWQCHGYLYYVQTHKITWLSLTAQRSKPQWADASWTFVTFLYLSLFPSSGRFPLMELNMIH